MFSQSADKPATDESPAPVGMRELPPQPAKPVMPAAIPVSAEPAGTGRPGPDDSVIARDDHFEGTFTSRGTVVVMGSVKGRIEAVQVRIEDGAQVEADVIVDEAIIAGLFTGNLTCRERLEARASGRINGRVETFKLMLHEGASVEGEMHMLTESPKEASQTIRGTAPVRGETREVGPEPESKPEPAARPDAPATKPAATVAPSAGPRPGTPGAAPGPGAGTSAVSGSATGARPAAQTRRAEGTSVPRRDPVAETLRAETLRVAPRASLPGPRSSRPAGGGSTSTTGSSNGSRGRSSTATTSF